MKEKIPYVFSHAWRGRVGDILHVHPTPVVPTTVEAAVSGRIEPVTVRDDNIVDVDVIDHSFEHGEIMKATKNKIGLELARKYQQGTKEKEGKLNGAHDP